MNTTLYETERLYIRPTSIDDAKFIFTLLNTPQWIVNIGDRNIKTVQDAANYITVKMLPQFKKLGFSNNTVIRKFDNKKIGTCGLYKRDGLDNVDIGFAFLPEFQKQGYAYEAAKKMIKIGISEFNITTINAITTLENVPSQKLIKKLGFIYQKMVKIPNDDIELMLFELRNS